MSKNKNKGNNPKKFGYDAVENTGRRRARPVLLRSEDRELLPVRRRALVSSARDLNRNLSIAAWALRKHVDFVASFEFQCRTGNAEFDKNIEGLMDWWSRPLNFDVCGRHGLKRFIRMCELRRTIDGDVLIVKMSDGRVQAIEGDRLQTPNQGLDGGLDLSSGYVNGVKISPSGRELAYVVCDRGQTGNSFVFKQEIPAEYAHLFGYFDRFDQVRGISPLASGLNSFQDIYECAEYALAKAKVSQLFGLKLTRSGDTALTPDDLTEQTAPYSFNFGAGPQILDLDHGDDAAFIESNTPSTEFAAYLEQMTAAALKSLDIPFSFYDESHATYSGSRVAILQYEQSAEAKQADVRELLHNLTVWRIQMWIDDGELKLPTGWGIDDITFSYVASGAPWVDPLKEGAANIAAISASLDSRQNICKENGKDWFTIVDQLAAEQQYLEKMGVKETMPTSISLVENHGNQNSSS